MSEDVLEFIVADESRQPRIERKSFGLGPDAPGPGATKSVSIDVDTLKTSLEGACEKFSRALKDIKQVGDFTLSEVTLQAEVSSSGGIKLIGSLEAGAKAAISLKFVAPQPATPQSTTEGDS